MKERLCPFAQPLLVKNDALRIRVSFSSDSEGLFADFDQELTRLVETSPRDGVESILLVLREFLFSFPDFYKTSWALQKRIVERGLEEKIQLVLFHPKAKHSLYQEDDEEDAANFTIRSPFPTFHLLRQEDVLKAVRAYPNAEDIPARNKEKFRSYGLERVQRKWKQCFQDDFA